MRSCAGQTDGVGKTLVPAIQGSIEIAVHANTQTHLLQEDLQAAAVQLPYGPTAEAAPAWRHIRRQGPAWHYHAMVLPIKRRIRLQATVTLFDAMTVQKSILPSRTFAMTHIPPLKVI